MPWLKCGDNAATYPKVMQTAGFKDADPDSVVNEVFGWLTRCMLQGAGHTTDYHLDFGTAHMLGGRRTDALITLCKRAGLLKEVKVAGMRGFKLIEDPEFMHMRLKAEVDAERQRQRDLGDPAVTVPVTLRDGDLCRYCGVLTQWRGKTSGRTRTLDHRNGLEEPGTVATLVVACMSCNSSRQDNPRWDDGHPLLPPPTQPVLGRWAAEYLTDHGHPTLPTIGATAKRLAPATGADTAPQQGVRPATGLGDNTAVSSSESVSSPIRTTSLGSGRVGSGPGLGGAGVGQERVGSGSGPGSGPGLGGAGVGQEWAGSGDPPILARRRGRRGRRG